MPRLTGCVENRSLQSRLSHMLVLLGRARQRAGFGGFRQGLSRLGYCCLLVVGLAGSNRAGAQPSSGKAIEEGLAQAQAAYEKQQFQQAEATLKGILAIPPAAGYQFAANELLGLTLTGQGKHAAASAYFRAAVRADPASVLGRANLAANLAQLNQHDLAEQEFLSALRLEPGSYELNHNLGEFYARLGRFRKAVPLLKRAYSIRPSDYSNGYDLALSQMEAGMLLDAELQVRTLIKLRDAAELHALLGTVFERQGKFVEAVAELQRGAQMDPTEGNLFGWGAELLRHQTLEPAMQVFRQGVKRYPRSWRMQVGLGVAALLHEDHGEAASALCAAIDLAPSDPRAYSYLVKIPSVPPALAGNVLGRFQSHAAAKPRDPEALFFYAVSLWNSSGEQPDSSDLAKVEALLRNALALDPSFAEAHLQLGLLYTRQQNHAAAVQEYERAIKFNASLRLAHYRLGQTLIQLGEEQRGRKQLEIWNQMRSMERAESEKAHSQLLQFVYSAPAEAHSRR